jgi:hypothetical protein
LVKTFPEAVEKTMPRLVPDRHRNWPATKGAEADAHGLALARAWVSLI